MHGLSVIAACAAIVPKDKSVAILRRPVDLKGTDDSSVADDEEWFSQSVQQLLGTNKPGTALDCITDMRFGERNCQRYARPGDAKPSAYFLRALLRTDHGGPFMDALMHGSKARWWRNLQKAKRIKEALDAVERDPN